MDGLAQETCRDFGHTGMGIAAAMHVAETSRIQGRDLYPQFKDRFRHALHGNGPADRGRHHDGSDDGIRVPHGKPQWQCFAAPCEPPTGHDHDRH